MPASDHILLKILQLTENDWGIEVRCPGAGTRFVRGFKSEYSARVWIADRRSRELAIAEMVAAAGRVDSLTH
jgi:hypothetical protein